MSAPLTDGINALTAYANEVTGASDTTLSDAVHTLASGYGGGDSTTAIIDDNTEYIHFEGKGNKKLTRFFSAQNARVLYIGGITNLDSPYFFEQMPNLEAVIFPDATNFAAYLFWVLYTDYAKTTVDIYQKQAFGSATVFRFEQGGNVILRNAEMSTTGFTATTWGVSNGIKFYVPSALRADYLADSNWSTFGSDRILPIEGTVYEDIDWWKALI